MRIVPTHEPIPNNSSIVYQVYNGLDCCLTHEILSAVKAVSPGGVPYDFVRAMQAPALEMMLTGLRVSLADRDAAVRHLEGEVTRLQALLNRYADAVWGKPLNPSSPKQMKEFFYGDLQLPEQLQRNKATGLMVPTCNRDALEKLSIYFHAKPIILAILAIRDRTKQIGTLRSEVDRDSRMRTSYNVAGTETARWSASENAFGSGTNLQNIPDRLRRIFVADPGRKLGYLDLEQAESRAVGIKCWQIFGLSNYIDACESGDLHTTTCRLVWETLPWTGDPKLDREIAEQPFYREYSYRDMSKRGGHGTNYYGRDYTMAKHLKVEKALITNFQHKYFQAFPEIRMWHTWVAQQLQLEQRLTTLFDRTRDFFGRHNDDTTLREAIAFEPQSLVGELLNLAAHRVWRAGPRLGVRVLAQLHDAILIDYPDKPDEESELLAEVGRLMSIPLEFPGRTFIIGNDAATGWNWGKYNDDPERGAINLGGVKKFKLGSTDTRKRPGEGLDRVVPGFH